MLACMHARTDVCNYVRMYVHLYVCQYVCEYVSLNMYGCTMYVCTYACVCM